MKRITLLMLMIIIYRFSSAQEQITLAEFGNILLQIEEVPNYKYEYLNNKLNTIAFNNSTKVTIREYKENNVGTCSLMRLPTKDIRYIDKYLKGAKDSIVTQTLVNSSEFKIIENQIYKVGGAKKICYTVDVKNTENKLDIFSKNTENLDIAKVREQLASIKTKEE